ncbi:MAG TPA: hypothetical protein EYQ61_11260 [Dehalococcoidia bacterium]|jgi:hypothetical protein|nr:hypothetical protein [Dehalococcoidia bacterium]HIK88901.1 hypothetical protein [Dehalococcoidia bacterium]
MIDRNLLDKVRPWIEASLGYPLPEAGDGTPTLGATPVGVDVGPFFAVRVDDVVAVSARSEWHEDLRPILDEIHPDLLFSVAGTFEFSRVTLPDGVAVWGPVPCYVADETTWKSANDPRVVKLTESQVSEIDWKIFWHCAGPESLAHFGIYEGGKLVSLSSVLDKGFSIYEIGVDAVQGSQARGLGTAVVGAAGDWILEHGATPFASAAAWNIASGRNLRRLGLQYTYSALISWEGEFMIPPQPIGQPLPEHAVYDKYPRWAMNKDILDNPE